MLTFTIPTSSFDSKLLPEAARELGTREFRGAVKQFFESELGELGGWRDIRVGDQTIEVRWTPRGKPADAIEHAIEKLKSGERQGAIVLLQLLLSNEPHNVAILYNLGMALSDVARLSEAEDYLRRASTLAPTSANIKVALGVALQRHTRTTEAIRELRDAVRIEPENPWAHRNLGACLATSGQLEDAERHLETATVLNPRDQHAWFGLGSAQENLGKKDRADQTYRRTIEIDEYSDVAELARRRLSKLAEATFRARSAGTERPDAVMYCLGALERFETMTPAAIQQVGFEIAALGTKGLDVNDADRRHSLRSLAGEFSGLHLVCLMYVAFQRIAPDTSIGFDLAREYEAAQSLHQPGRRRADQP